MLIGNGGDDTLIAGPHSSGLSGGSGNDTIYAVNGAADGINCGDGIDTATVDKWEQQPEDTVNCERVRTRG